jgi:hypothetical protein
MKYKLSTLQALKLVVVLDELKRVDFKSCKRFGIDFGGWYDRAYGTSRSGCSKIDCITSIVKYLMGESMGPNPEHVAEWLEEKVPGWKEKIGYKGDNNE